MATAAFKSNSKRSGSGSGSDGYGGRNPNPNPKPKLRRSLSVNAVSRSTEIDVSTEFLNKRDNPLYWATGVSDNNNNTEIPTPNVVRGRSDKRNVGQKEEISGRRRSLSRVNGAGRRGRSVSRAKSPSENEAEEESISHGKLPVSGIKSFNRPSFDSQVLNCEDGISASEAEEKTIKAVYEQMKSFEVKKDTASIEIYETVRSEVRRAIADIQDDIHNAIRRNSSGSLVSTVLSPKLVKPGAVELVVDIRREYAKELEASQERARKLRSDLATEEHHKQELSRILKETLPEPKTSSSHRSRLGRKSSSERKKMSKCLTDEAMSYFDECVSISTFDSSDFSAAEDPPSVNSAPNSCIDQQIAHGDPVSSSVVENNCNELVMDSTEWDRKVVFSFGHKKTESIKLQCDIESYIKTFEKDGISSGYNYSTDAYGLLDVSESLLFDKVFFRNRQDSGSMHICSEVAVPFFPFPHLF